MTGNNFTFKEPDVLNHPQSEMIFIQKSDLELRLIDFKENIGLQNDSRSSIGDWIGLVALIIVPFTANFEGFLGLSSENIKAIYCGVVIIVGFLFITKFINLVNYWRTEKTIQNSPDPRKYIEEIKNSCNAVLPMNSKKPPKIKKN